MGGTIPFMAMLGEKFPQAAVPDHRRARPHSNAHGPNEFLHIAYAKKLTACVADGPHRARGEADQSARRSPRPAAARRPARRAKMPFVTNARDVVQFRLDRGRIEQYEPVAIEDQVAVVGLVVLA